MLKNQLQILEQAFEYFSKEKFNGRLNESNTVITIQTRGKQNCYGWCTVQEAWYKSNTTICNEDIENNLSHENNYIEEYYEINLSAEYMNRSFYNIMETLLHEMIHLSNILDGIEDCNKKQYHNENFKDRAESIGLVVEKIKQYGWASTYLGDKLKEMVDRFVSENNIDVSVFVIARKDKEVKKVIRNNKKIKMICNGCRNVISCDDEIEVVCKNCGIEFVRK